MREGVLRGGRGGAQRERDRTVMKPRRRARREAPAVALPLCVGAPSGATQAIFSTRLEFTSDEAWAAQLISRLSHHPPRDSSQVHGGKKIALPVRVIPSSIPVVDPKPFEAIPKPFEAIPKPFGAIPQSQNRLADPEHTRRRFLVSESRFEAIL